MRCDEIQAGEDRSLDGRGDGCDGRSVSTLDIADAASSCKMSGEAQSQKDLTPYGKDKRRESVMSLQVEDTDQEALRGRCMKNFQCDMKFCTFAFLAVSLLFVIIIISLCFTQQKQYSSRQMTTHVTLTTTTLPNILQ